MLPHSLPFLELPLAMLPSSERSQWTEQVSRVSCPETSHHHRQGPLSASVKPPAQKSRLGSFQASCLSSCVAPATSLNLSGLDFKCAGITFRISALLTSLRHFEKIEKMQNQFMPKIPATQESGVCSGECLQGQDQSELHVVRPCLIKPRTGA